jgi:thioredoxin 1
MQMQQKGCKIEPPVLQATFFWSSATKSLLLHLTTWRTPPFMNDQTILNQIKQAPRPLVVDVWAPWCSPCRAMSPALEKLKGEYQGKVDVLKVNSDEHPDLVRQWSVQGIPTLLIFRSGDVQGRLVGMQPQPALREFFDYALTGEGELKPHIAPLERTLRLLGGLALIAYALFSSGSWILAGVGALIAFSAVHDRCPIWQAVKPRLKSLVGLK